MTNKLSLPANKLLSGKQEDKSLEARHDLYWLAICDKMGVEWRTMSRIEERVFFFQDSSFTHDNITMTTTATDEPSETTSEGSGGRYQRWIPIVEDDQRQSYAYWHPFQFQDGSTTIGTSPPSSSFLSSPWTTREQLDAWFDALHPSQYENNEGGNSSISSFGSPLAPASSSAWTESYHNNEKLLRQTAWVSLDPRCTCEYGYADTWQHQATNPKFIHTIQQITDVVVSHFEKKTRSGQSYSSSSLSSSSSTLRRQFNAVNLNYYPQGGGVGFHADDEFLFDGLNRPTCILSLSLCSRQSTTETEEEGTINTSYSGVRKFVVKRKKPGDTEDGVQDFDVEEEGLVDTGTIAEPSTTKEPLCHEVILRHGDLMTMEGMFQKHYYHAVWPGDSKQFQSKTSTSSNDRTKTDHDHPYTHGERINLTWRLIVQHLDGSKDECRGKSCPLSLTKTGAKKERS
jgi:alkylated DNA repair dioxygenase AlkB